MTDMTDPTDMTARSSRSPERRGPGTGAVVAAICGDDLRHIVRDRTALLFMIVMPVVVMVIIGATIGGAPSAVPVGLVDGDGSPASAGVRRALADSGALAVQGYDSADDLRRDVRLQTISGGVVVPAGFGATLDRGGTGELGLVVDLTQTGGQSLATVVQAAIAREGSVRAATRFAVEQTRPAGTGTGAADDTGSDDTAADDTAAVAARARALAGQIPPVPVQVASTGDRPAGALANRYSYPAISNLVLFVFVSALAGGAALVERRRLGVTRRMLAAPVTTRAVIVGTTASRLLVCVLQSATIVLVGGLLFRVSWGDPLGAALVVITFAALATGVSLLVGALARNAEQAQAIGIPVAIGLGMLGGTMWPLEIVPRPLQVIGHLTPHAWAMDAWIELVYEQAGTAAVLTDVAVLAAIAAVLTALSSLALRRSLAAS